MVAQEAATSFQDKWRHHFPEWTLAEVFLPAAQRDTALAWFALLQEFADAAWGGSDPTPGLAKLAWWQEELRGWAKGARRHPLGGILQPQPAPWQALADAMGVLRHRDLPADAAGAVTALRDLQAAVSNVEAVLFSAAPGSTASTLAMLAPAALAQGDAAAARALQGAMPPERPRSRPARLFAAIVAMRLADAAAGHGWRPPQRWRSLWAFWSAARN